jgi:hypothetical protein
LRFVVGAGWAGGDMAVVYVDRYGVTQSTTVTTTGLGGTTVNTAFVCSKVTSITNTSAGVNGSRIVSVEMRSVICTPHVPVTDFIAVWDDIVGEQLILSSDLVNGWVEIAGPLGGTYHVQYTITLP